MKLKKILSFVEWNSKLKKFLPFIEWVPKLRNKKILRNDITAGITVALVLVPQSMAYAWLAWLPLEVWLYTAFIPVIIWALFWSSHQMSTWPVTIVSLMTATTLSMMPHTSIEWYIVYASLLALFIGLFYILLWVLKLWIIVDFLSHPVIVSFTNAVAIITITSQLSKIFWISVSKWWSYF
jgi:SulP family sulfate permease